jgi:DNA-binding protein
MSDEEPKTDEASPEAETKELAKETEQAKEEASTPKTEEAKEEPEAKGTKAPAKTRREDNVIYIGNKPPMNYVMALITAFNMQDTDNVVLKARGRAISTAVDVAEITRNRFFKDAEVKTIAIGTEEIAPREGGNPRNVSTIEISLHK